MPALVPADRLFLTDSGLETDLLFHHEMELPALPPSRCWVSPQPRWPP